jgi:hypothetical protein
MVWRKKARECVVGVRERKRGNGYLRYKTSVNKERETRLAGVDPQHL